MNPEGDVHINDALQGFGESPLSYLLLLLQFTFNLLLLSTSYMHPFFQSLISSLAACLTVVQVILQEAY